MQFTAAGYLKGLRGLCILHAKGYVRIELSVQPVANVTAGDILAVLAGKRRVVDAEGHRDRGLGNLLERNCLGCLGRADRITDMEIGDAGNGYDGTNLCFGHFHTAQALELVELTDLDLAHLVWIVVVYDHALLVDFQRSVIHFSNADPADIFIVVDRTDQHLCAGVGIALGRRNIVDDGLKQRLHACARTSEVQCCNTGLSRCEYEGAVDLLVAGAKIHQKFEDLVDHLRGAGAGTVNLVDADNDGKIQGHCLAKHKACLGHRTFKRINNQNYAVDHLENTLHFAAEIRMSGGVNNIDLDALIINGCIFTQNRDSTLSFNITGVHDSFLYGLVFTEHAALAQQAVDQCRLAVVNVCDDCYISDIFSSLDHSFSLLFAKTQFCLHLAVSCDHSNNN